MQKKKKTLIIPLEKKNKSRPKTGIIKQKKNKNFFEKNKKFESNPFKDNSFEEYNNRKTNNIVSINDEQNNFKSPINLQTKVSRDTNTNTVGQSSFSGDAHTHNRSKGKKSNNFVNEKMKIKPDPNKSIFKAIPNPAFFSQGNKKNKDIIVMAKEKPKNLNLIQNNNFINNINNNMSKNNFNNEKNNKKNDLFSNEDLNNKDNNANYDKNKEINDFENEIDENRNLLSKKNEREKESSRYKNMFNIEKESEKIEDGNNNINSNEEKGNYNDYYNDNDNYSNNDKINEYNYEIKKNNNYEKEKGIESEGVDQNIIHKLLIQMDFLTKGHESLMNMFDNIQIDTQEQIENLNKNFENLESKTNILDKDLDDYYTNSY